MAHDPPAGLRLAVALAPWWYLRGRAAGQYPVLRETADRAAVASDGWCAAQFWLGWAALYSVDMAGALGHFSAVSDAIGARGPSRVLADCLAGRSIVLANLARFGEAVHDGRQALVQARELSYPAGEALALEGLVIVAGYTSDFSGALRLARQAEQIMADPPGWLARFRCRHVVGALNETGDLAAAEDICAAGLARAREVGDLLNLTRLLTETVSLALRAGRADDAAVYLRELLLTAARTGAGTELFNGVGDCGFLCAATGRHAEAATLWAAFAALQQRLGFTGAEIGKRRRQEAMREARQALGPDVARAAEERGAAMSLATAAEYALMLAAPGPRPAEAGPGPGPVQLSARERELVTLVAQGLTDAQIAARLHISVRTVRSHLDRIRDKTGCRRRTDLTRLALTEGLV
jgi:DNA-binding CsgD family transcriptional regulator